MAMSLYTESLIFRCAIRTHWILSSQKSRSSMGSRFSDPVYSAIRDGAPESVVSALLTPRNINGALLFALICKRWDLVAPLLGADIIGEEDYARPLDLSTKRPPGSSSTAVDNSVRRRGADRDLRCDEDGNTPLHKAVNSVIRAPDHVITQLISPTNIDMGDHFGMTPLHLALRYDHELSLEKLISPKNINMQCDLGVTPLLEAVGAKKWKYVRFLLDRGADVNLATCCSNTPLHRAALNPSIDLAPPVDTFVRLISPRTINAKTEVMKQTPLELAVKFGRCELIPALIQHGADPYFAGVLPTPPRHRLSLQSWSIGKIRNLMREKSDEALENLPLPPLLRDMLKMESLAEEIVAKYTEPSE